MSEEKFNNPHYIENSPQRCYWCKRSIVDTLGAYARQQGLAFLIDGSNVEDVSYFRHLLAHREQIVAELRKLGYVFVTLDLSGYRTGSLNQASRKDYGS